MPELPSERAGQTPSIRRSITLPTKLNPQAQRGWAAPGASENLIFYHPATKIVQFAPRALVPIPSSSAPSDFDYPVDTIETLPWRSATERTVATAPLRLEKVHGLTVFLKCGNVVHAILKNSQCWCVDGVSKFVLRIRPLTYYRIELPHETEEEQRAVEDLKAALPTVLRYEVTPCPFKRAFTVELPEEAMAPRRKKAWQPKDRRQSAPAVSGSSPEPPFATYSEGSEDANTGDGVEGNTTDDSDLVSIRANSSTLETIPDEDESPSPNDTLELSVPPAMPRRSVTETRQTFTSLLAKYENTPMPEAEIQPDTVIDAPTADTSVADVEDRENTNDREDADVSRSSSPESFHSADLPSPSDSVSTHPTPMECPGSAGKVDGGHAPGAMEGTQYRDASGPVNKPKLKKLEIPQGDNSTMSASIHGGSPKSLKYTVREDPRHPSLGIPSATGISSQPAATPTTLGPDFNHMSTEFRRRAQATRQREISPMPPPSAIYQPPPRPDAASLLSKALTAVLVPPVHLLIILLHIAARIVISPAANSSVQQAPESQRRGQEQATENDFSFPLEPDASSDYEDADMSRTSDPWDLD